jgi:hypothetical protein
MKPRPRLLKYLRDLADVSQGQLQRAAGVDTHYICNAERHGDHLGRSQGEKLCAKLGWTGDPEELTMFADEVEGLEGKIDRAQVERLHQMGASGELGRRRGGRAKVARDDAKGAAGGVGHGVMAEAVR